MGAEPAVDPRSLLDVARACAREAGAVLAARVARPRSGVGTKSTATDMVSDADRASEALIVARLQGARPDDAIIGEEGTSTAGTSGLRWIIDPLDGTTNFLFGIPHFAVSIACEDERGGVAAAIFDPMRDEMFLAARGEGATCNGEPIAVSRGRPAREALIATGFSYRPGEREDAARALVSILPRVRDIRRAGAAALDLAWTACGRVDGFFEAPIEEWDVAAGRLIVTEAGGRTAAVSTADGRAGLLAAGDSLFDDLLLLTTLRVTG